MLAHFAFIGVDVDHVAHLEFGDIHLDGQGTGVFHGVEEDRGDLAAEAETAGALVGHVGDVVAEEPQHGVGGRLARGASADHVAHVGDREALGLHFLDLLQRAGGAGHFRNDAFALVLEHGVGMQRNVGARPGVRRGGEVVGVGLARHLEDGESDLLGQCWLGEEPLGLGPGLHDVLGHRVAGLGALFHVVEGIEHQQGVLELFAGLLGELGIVQQLDQGGDVVAALHGAQ